MSKRFDGKSVIVTGASAGVGAAVARAFAAEGARLMLVARRREPLNEIRAELEGRTRVEVFPLDVADVSGCGDLVRKTVYEYGCVHYLVNNAGVHVRGAFETVAADDIATMVDVNLRAPLVLARLALDAIRAAGGGAIINVASLAGTTPVPGSATYSATKFGLRAFTLALADELAGSNVHVGAVSPGPIDTGFIMDEIDGVADLTFSQPMSTAEQVAEAVLQVAEGRAVDVKMPRMSGVMATASYLFPSLKRALRPMLERKGRKAKAYYKARGARGGS